MQAARRRRRVGFSQVFEERATVDADLFQQLVAQGLTSVTFVGDHLRLQFTPPPALRVYGPLRVRCGDRAATVGEPTFPPLIHDQIGKVVRGVSFRPADALEISFEDGSTISISLRKQDHVGVDAIDFWLGPGDLVVV